MRILVGRTPLSFWPITRQSCVNAHNASVAKGESNREGVCLRLSTVGVSFLPHLCSSSVLVGWMLEAPSLGLLSRMLTAMASVDCRGFEEVLEMMPHQQASRLSKHVRCHVMGEGRLDLFAQYCYLVVVVTWVFWALSNRTGGWLAIIKLIIVQAPTRNYNIAFQFSC